MKSTKYWQLIWLMCAVALAILAPGIAGSGIVSTPPNGRLKGGPDGAGGVPKASGPQSPNTTSTPIKALTVGQVIDAVTRQPIANTLIVVTNSLGEIAGLATTDIDGIFALYLYAEPDLELAIPAEGVAGLPIAAGDILTILVP